MDSSRNGSQKNSSLFVVTYPVPITRRIISREIQNKPLCYQRHRIQTMAGTRQVRLWRLIGYLISQTSNVYGRYGFYSSNCKLLLLLLFSEFSKC